MNIFERRRELIKQRDKKKNDYLLYRAKLYATGKSKKRNVTLDNLLAQVTTLDEQIVATEGIIAGYGLFLQDEIVYALEDLISCSEGAKFCFCSSYCVDSKKNEPICLFVDRNEKKINYDSSSLRKLKDTKKALIFMGRPVDLGILSFYPYDFERVSPCNLGDFGFVKSFIDEVICYKEKNKLQLGMIGKDTVNALKDDFISRNIDNFLNCYDLVDNQDEEEIVRLSEQIKERKVYRKRLIDLKNNND